MPNYCCVLHCKNKGSDPGIYLYTLTKRRYIPWMKAIGRDPVSSKQSHSNVVCNQHFTSNDFHYVGGRKRLKTDAVPNVNMGLHEPLAVLESSSPRAKQRAKTCRKDISVCEEYSGKVCSKPFESHYLDILLNRLSPDEETPSNPFELFRRSALESTDKLASDEHADRSILTQGEHKLPVPQIIIRDLPPLVPIKRGVATLTSDSLPPSLESKFPDDPTDLPPLVPIRRQYLALPISDPPPLVPIQPASRKLVTMSYAGINLETNPATIKTEELESESLSMQVEDRIDNFADSGYAAHELDEIKKESVEIDEEGNIHMFFDGDNAMSCYDVPEYVWVKTEPLG